MPQTELKVQPFPYVTTLLFQEPRYYNQTFLADIGRITDPGIPLNRNGAQGRTRGRV